MISIFSEKQLVNRILKGLTSEKRQQFYEEYGTQRRKGMEEKKAISLAFQKIGMEDPFTSMKITLPEQVLFGVHIQNK